MNGKERKRKIKYCLRGQDGVTLVELIVTFAMIGLFMTAAAFMITSSLRLFTRMQATSRAITVSDMILDKVAGEISAAAFPVGQPKQDDYYFWLDPNGEWVVFKNRLDSPIAIFAANRNEDGTAKTDTLGEGELFVRYYKLEGSNVQQQAELDWRYDDRVYMGYRISDLRFSQADAGKDPSVIRIDLTLVHKDTKFEYPTHRYARVYNMAHTGPYLGLRSEFEPENTGLPVEAKEFEIKKKDPGSGEGEKQENTFRVHHMYGSTLILEEIFPGIPGTVMTIYAKSPSDEGFENYVPKKSSMEITVDELGIVRTYYFEYELKKDGPFTVYFVSKRTGKDVKEPRVYTDVELNKPFGITLPYVAGYVTPTPEWQEIMFTDTVRSHTFYYEPILWKYTVYFRARGGEDLLPAYKGELYTDESTVVKAPVIPGYVPEDSERTITAIRDDQGGNEFIIYYDLRKSDSNHPFMTNGDKTKVEENDKPHPGHGPK